MFDLIYRIIGYVQTGTYTGTIDGYCIQICGALLCILTVVFLDWLRLLFRALINRLK